VPRIILLAFPIASALLIFSSLHESRSSEEIGAGKTFFSSGWLEIIFATVMIGVSVVMYMKIRRDRALLRDGELAIGVVTHQKLVAVRGGRGGRRFQSKVRYAFKDASGELFQGTGTDDSRILHVDSTVPVFYNRTNPAKNVTLCTAVCELRNN
jgi:hypothetical protein